MRHAVLTLLIIAVSGATPAGSLAARPAHRNHAKTTATSTHSVRKGETAGRIAQAQGLSLAQLQALNPGRDLAHLSIGTKLHIARASVHAAPQIAADRIAPSDQTVRLAKGQTLYALAKANGISVHDLMAANPDLNPRRLRPGTALHLPGSDKASDESSVAEAPVATEASTLAPLPAIPSETNPDTATVAPSSDLSALPVIPNELPRLAREGSLLPSDEPGSEPVAAFKPADPNNLDLFWPVETRSISSYWGPRMRTHVVRVKNRRKKRVRYHSRHKGIDLPAPMHTDIYAALDGVVVYSGKARGYGNLVTLDHGNGVTTVYGHESVTLVHEGDIVHRGEKIAEVGRAGNATGPHLHFELRIDGVAQNPLPVLDDTEEVAGDLAAQNGQGPSSN